MRGLYLILLVVSLILIVFGIIFAILYAFENEKKRSEEPGSYWGLVLGLGVGTAIVGLTLFIIVIYLSQRKIVRAEISTQNLYYQFKSIEAGGLKYLTLDNREVINVYDQATREKEEASKLEEKKRKVMQQKTDSRVTSTTVTPPPVSVSSLSPAPVQMRQPPSPFAAQRPSPFAAQQSSLQQRLQQYRTSPSPAVSGIREF